MIKPSLFISIKMGALPLIFLSAIFLLPLSHAQLVPSEGRILVQLQQLLEYPPLLQGWNDWTNFCYLPTSPSLSIICSTNHVTEITIAGNRTSPLSSRFSMDTFFTVVTKLTSLKVLSLVSMGLWGRLPVKINRFSSLQVMNLSSNFIYGEIPMKINWLGELRSLVLSHNLINGSVPNLSTLHALEEVDLSSNALGPDFPILGDNLVSLILRNNFFRTLVSAQHNSFDHLQYFDISSNQIMGPIPSTLFSLPWLWYLNLSGNKLSGALSTNISCSNGLKFVDVSHNFLIGNVTPCYGSKSWNQVMIYSWNCLSVDDDRNDQHPYSFCQKEAIAVNPVKQDQNNGSPATKVKLIFCVGGAILGCLGALGFLVLAVFRRRTEVKKVVNNIILEKSVSGKASLHLSPRIFAEARVVTPAMRFGAIGLAPYHVFSMEEIEETTNYFDPLNSIGEGSQSQLYKGWYRDGCTVVIKCLKLKQRHSHHNILQQMELISKFRHRHLVSIIGHCIVSHQDYPNATNSIYLVFEYVSNGTLLSHLTDGRKREMLKWPQRIGITIGIAKGIQFLHTGISPGIFGNVVNIEHVLLDENLSAKISNYNLPISSKVGSASSLTGLETVDVLGSEPGQKEDIYQLGAIMLELILGKPITSRSEMDTQRFQLEQSLVESPPILGEFVDKSMCGTFADESLRTMAEITVSCLSEDPNKRPSIEDVVWNLQYSFQVQDGWTTGGENLSTHS